MRQILFFLFVICSFSSNGQSADGKYKADVSGSEKQINSTYTYKVLLSNNCTWCYDIYKDKKIFIHQNNIPGLPGNEGFKSRKDAANVACLVIKKLKNGDMPPSVTLFELKKLKVLLTN